VYIIHIGFICITYDILYIYITHVQYYALLYAIYLISYYTTVVLKAQYIRTIIPFLKCQGQWYQFKMEVSISHLHFIGSLSFISMRDICRCTLYSVQVSYILLYRHIQCTYYDRYLRRGFSWFQCIKFSSTTFLNVMRIFLLISYM